MASRLKVAKVNSPSSSALFAQLRSLAVLTETDFRPQFLDYDVLLSGDDSVTFEVTSIVKSLYTQIGNLVFFEQEFTTSPDAANTSTLYVKAPVQAVSQQSLERDRKEPVLIALKASTTQGSGFLFTRDIFAVRENGLWIRIDKFASTGASSNYAVASHRLRIRGAYFI